MEEDLPLLLMFELKMKLEIYRIKEETKAVTHNNLMSNLKFVLQMESRFKKMRERSRREKKAKGMMN